MPTTSKVMTNPRVYCAGMPWEKKLVLVTEQYRRAHKNDKHVKDLALWIIGRSPWGPQA